MNKKYGPFSYLKPSRKKLRVGDVFVMRMDDGYLHGLIARTDVKIVDGLFLLLFIHKRLSQSPEDIPTFCCEDLLLPPTVATREGWTHGYFETVGFVPDPPKCPMSFYCMFRERWTDIDGEPISGPVGDVGTLGISPVWPIGEMVVNALAGKQPFAPGSPRPGPRTPLRADWSRVQRDPLSDSNFDEDPN